MGRSSFGVTISERRTEAYPLKHAFLRIKEGIFKSEKPLGYAGKRVAPDFKNSGESFEFPAVMRPRDLSIQLTD
jgi:hypothetical protein